MVKRAVAIAVFLLALSLTAFANSIALTEPHDNTAVGIDYHRGKDHKPCKAVPEPASVLLFGSGLLLGGRFLKRRFSGC
jgi:hypothetical protein